MAQIEQDDEICFADIWTTLKYYRQLILLAPLIGAIIAYIFVMFMVAPTWEASAIVQVGQVGQVGQVAKLVEPIQNVTFRMMQPSFQAGMFRQSNLNINELAGAKDIYGRTLKVSKVKDAELIEFKVRGYSADMAKSLTDTSISYLQKIHSEFFNTMEARLKAQIQMGDEESKLLKAEIAFLNKQLQGNHDWNSYNATLAATVLHDKSRQLRELSQVKLILAEQLSPSITFVTRVVGDVSVSEEPVSPKKGLIIGLAVLIGLVGGIFVAFAHNWVSKGAKINSR